MSLRFSARLTMRFGCRRRCSRASCSIGAGLLLFARTPVDASYLVDVCPR